MKLINPSEISGKILTLLEESDERMIIVSPYMKISKWYRLLNKLNDLKAKSIPIEIYVRDDHRNKETYQDMDQLELPLRFLFFRTNTTKMPLQYPIWEKHY